MDYKVQLSNIKNSMVLKDITKDSYNFLVYNILKETKFNFINYIVDNNFSLELAKKELEFYSKDIEIIKFPEWNIIPYDVNSPQLKIQIEKMEAIYKLINYENLYKNKKVVFLIAKNSLVQKIIDKDDYKFINLHLNDKIFINEFKNILEENCYELVETSLSIGNYSINNSTIDIITFENQCYRILIHDNLIKEIKSFDPNSQISSKNYTEILILPIKEVIFNKDNIKNFKQNYRNNFNISNEKDDLYKNISNEVFYDGCENWLPLFYNDKLATIFDYIPSNSIFVYSNNINRKIKNFVEQIKNYHNLRIGDSMSIYNPIEPNLLYLNINEISEFLKSKINIVFDPENEIKNERQMELNFKNVPNFNKEYKEIFVELTNYLSK